jgi:hypothetical protein
VEILWLLVATVLLETNVTLCYIISPAKTIDSSFVAVVVGAVVRWVQAN